MTKNLAGITILGTGSYLPETVVTNDMMAGTVLTSDEWIRSRTGIESRCFVSGEDNLFMVKQAAEAAISAAGIAKEDVAVIICASITNEYLTPSLSCRLQKTIGLPQEALIFDINAACSGFVYALKLAHALLADSPGKYALLSGSEVLSRIMDFEDRSTCVLFGDGAGAAVVGRGGEYFCFDAGAKGDADSLYCYSVNDGENPFSSKISQVHSSYVRMNGREVFRFAVESIEKSIRAVLAQTNETPSAVDLFVCHQANRRIISAAAKRLGIGEDKFFINIDKRGNTSAASIPIALDEMVGKGLVRRGDKIVLSGFGGGLTYGSAYFVW